MDGLLDRATTNGNNPAASCFSNPSYICTTSGYLRFHGVPGPDPYIYRQIDLSDPTIASASLIFDLSTAGSLSGVDAFTVQISNDGGSSWTELQQYNNDQNLTDATFDISAYMASNTQIRFGVANYTLNPGQYFEIDNARIDVQYNPAFAPANDFAITDPDTNINLTVLDNDGTDVDASSVTFPTQSAGTVSGGGSILTVPNEGVYTVQGDGSITFLTPIPTLPVAARRSPTRSSNTGGTSTNTATVQVLIDERALCVPSDPNNIGYALASAGDNTAGTPRVYVVEISDPGAGTNPGNAQLLFDHNVIAAAQNGDGDPSNDIPYLGSAPTGAPAPDPSVVPLSRSATVVSTPWRSIPRTSASTTPVTQAAPTTTRFLSTMVQPVGIGRFIVDVTNLSSSECPSAACSNLQVGGTRGLNDAGAEYNAGRLFLGAENVSGNVDRIYYIDIDEVGFSREWYVPAKGQRHGTSVHVSRYGQRLGRYRSEDANRRHQP